MTLLVRFLVSASYCRSGSFERREIEANTPFNGHRPESSRTRLCKARESRQASDLPTQWTEIAFFSLFTCGFMTSPKT